MFLVGYICLYCVYVLLCSGNLSRNFAIPTIKKRFVKAYIV